MKNGRFSIKFTCKEKSSLFYLLFYYYYYLVLSRDTLSGVTKGQTKSDFEILILLKVARVLIDSCWMKCVSVCWCVKLLSAAVCVNLTDTQHTHCSDRARATHTLISDTDRRSTLTHTLHTAVIVTSLTHVCIW